MFGIILIVIWIIVGLNIAINFLVFEEKYKSFFIAISDFRYSFSISHFTKLIAFSVLLCFIFYCIRHWEDDKKSGKLNIFYRWYYTFIDHDNLTIKAGVLLTLLTVSLFSFLAIKQIAELPEVAIALFLFSIVGVFDLMKKGKISPANQPSYIFTDEPVEKYSLLNDFQKTEIRNLKNLLELRGDEYLSIAINGSWGTGKTSILKGLKDLLINGCLDEKIAPCNVEVFELNLWQARTPENAINELERLFKELFSKTYISVSSRDMAFFSVLIGPLGSDFSTLMNKWLFENDSINVARNNLEEKLSRVLKLLSKRKVVILIDDLDRTPEQYLNCFLKVICYVVGLRNVVAISGINREKILSQVGKLDEITFFADGLSPLKKIALEENKRESQRSGSPSPNEPKKKGELKFNKFDNEPFLTKIFSVQRELVSSNFHIKNFEANYQSFQESILFEDKDMIIDRIKQFIDKNYIYINTYRDIKLLLNEIFIYIIGFARNKQDEIKLSDYIEFESIFALAWAKVIYPDFYKEIQNYVVPFMYQKEINKSSFKLKEYIHGKHSFYDEGEDKIVNTVAHRQIRSVFSDLKGDKSLYNFDSAIRYFSPIIEPYEFTNTEFSKNFVDGQTTVERIQRFIEPKWKLNPQYVLDDFLRRVKVCDFYPTDRLNSAIALMDAIAKTKESEEYNIYEHEINLWIKVISLFENISPLSRILGQDRLTKYDNLKSIFSISLELFLDLWERKYFLIEDIDLTGPGPINFKNPFYRFFNVSDFPDDEIDETKKNYKALLDMVSVHKFQAPENKLHCLMFIYKLSANFWDGNNRKVFKRFHFSKILPFFLESLYQMLESVSLQEFYSFQDLIFDCVQSKCDDILFDLSYLEKLVMLLKNNIFFYTEFLDRLKNRSESCTLYESKRKLVYEKLIKELDDDPQFFNTGYHTILKNFFRIDEVFL